MLGNSTSLLEPQPESPSSSGTESASLRSVDDLFLRHKVSSVPPCSRRKTAHVGLTSRSAPAPLHLPFACRSPRKTHWQALLCDIMFL